MAGDPPSSETALHHLSSLRDLLRRDYLSCADWSFALHDLAAMARDAIGASEAFVAIYGPQADAWTAVACDGARLTSDQISRRGSRSLLDRVRATEKPFLGTDDEPLQVSSASLRAHRVDSVLAVPLHWWDVTERRPRRQFGGCIYAHRTVEEDPFDKSDVELILDIAAIAQRTLNVLRHLRDVEADLAITRQHARGIERGTHRLGEYETRDPFFGESVIAKLERVAQADRVGLLLAGPTGSGKTHLARAYHNECPRRSAPFVVLDASQVTSDETLAAELFGYAPRSGFANSPPSGRAGAAERADGGTLFIDEIATLPAELQQRLLTLIQTGTFSPLGASEKKTVDLQVIAATNEDLKELVTARRFREDLFWRISVVTIELPALNRRQADIPTLAETFLTRGAAQFGRHGVRGLSQSALDALAAHDWSVAGNIRGLEHTIYRSLLFSSPDSRELDAPDLDFQSLSGGGLRPTAARPDAASVRGAEPELERVKLAIREHGFATAAARALGITHGAVVWQLRKAGLTVRDVLAEAARSDA